MILGHTVLRAGYSPGEARVAAGVAVSPSRSFSPSRRVASRGCATRRDTANPESLPPAIHSGVAGASGPLGRCALVYNNNNFISTILWRTRRGVNSLSTCSTSLCRGGARDLPTPTALRQLARAPEWQKLGFLCHNLSAEGVSVTVDPRKVQSSSTARCTSSAVSWRATVGQGRSTADGAWQPDSAVHVDGRDSGERVTR